ncbi:histidinol-phosphatase (PHP family) [Evansella vedderi]|uniref:Histidinol-phosphatase n=1 Tax=Evansella vedderi TaxID=38282 RepID=A0ABT9ZW85_9BACI|nr:histidinol-phosphatase HisJ [Evansella vedderi]MDQ0255012.1 histidinol-phosphatase (PHP family) [Evansella vedderi]
MYIKDGHIHSPYCPHGTTDPFEKYIKKAIHLGYNEMTFTEHAPLPKGFKDPVPQMDSAMSLEQLEFYFQAVKELQVKYEKIIKINVGLEIDFIEGFEEETEQLLNKWGHELDDAILSVHFLKCSRANRYICLDYSPSAFESLIDEYSTLEGVYEKYYRTIELSITSNLGKYKPNRIGHITLVRKFQRRFPRSFDDSHYIINTLNSVNDRGLTLDINGAGLLKPLCREFYPPLEWVKMAASIGIPLVYGSDAHSAEQLGEGLEEFYNLINY